MSPKNASRNYEDNSWYMRAECRDEDPEIFFGGNKGPAFEAAILVCSRCVVIEQCRNHALVFPELSGTWGGLNEDQKTAKINS
jgi:WhiB family redox-sensing transcriptional regulator